MIQSRLIVSILFLFSFFAYYLYHYNIAMIGMSNNRDDRTYNPLIVTQHFHHSSNFFICKPHHDYCERTASSEWNMIRAQIYTILNRRLNKDPQSIFTRDDIPNIIPPLPETGCESKDDFARVLCEGNVQRIIKIAACVGAGLVTVPAIFFIAWTLARWIRVVRPRKETILIGKEAKKRAVGLTGRASWARGGGHIQELFLGKESYLNEKSLSGSGAKKARNRIEEKEVWYGGVRMTIPWKRGENWNHAVAQLPSKGTTQGMLVGMSPNSSSIYILEPEQFNRGSRAAGRSTLAVSENTRNDCIRVVSTGRDAHTDGEVVSQKKGSGSSWNSDLERGQERCLGPWGQ